MHILIIEGLAPLLESVTSLGCFCDVAMRDTYMWLCTEMWSRRTYLYQDYFWFCYLASEFLLLEYKGYVSNSGLLPVMCSFPAVCSSDILIVCPLSLASWTIYHHFAIIWWRHTFLITDWNLILDLVFEEKQSACEFFNLWLDPGNGHVYLWPFRCHVPNHGVSQLVS